jgi:hypothetical protein
LIITFLFRILVCGGIVHEVLHNAGAVFVAAAERVGVSLQGIVRWKT